MQLFVTFLSVLLIAFASADDMNNKRNAIIQKCKSELSASDDVVSIANAKKEASTEQEKCFLQCFYENLGLIKDGKLSSEGSDALAKSRFGDKTDLIHKAHEIFERCRTSFTPSSEKCALGKHIRNCFIQNDSEQLNFFSKQ